MGISLAVSAMIFASVGFCSSNVYAQTNLSTVTQQEQYLPGTQALVDMLDKNPTLKALLEKSIQKASVINPDPQTNPAQNLKAYVDYVNWAERAMPWAILPGVEKNHPKLYNRIDQSLNYFYFVNDRPLEELKDKGLYIPSVQYVEPYRSWLIDFTRRYGEFLSTPQSWNDDYLAAVKTDKRFGLDTGEYEDPSHWKSFNDFFVRRLASPDKRPIAEAADDSVVVFPGDSVTQGVWEIGTDNMLTAPAGKTVDVSYNVVVELSEENKNLLSEASEAAFAANGVTYEEKLELEGQADPNSSSQSEFYPTGNDFTLRYVFDADVSSEALANAVTAINEAVDAASLGTGASVTVTTHTLSLQTFNESLWRAAVAVLTGAVVALIYVGVRFGVLGLWLVRCMKLRENAKDPAFSALAADEAVAQMCKATDKAVFALAGSALDILAVCAACMFSGGAAVIAGALVPVAAALYSSTLLAPALHVRVKAAFDKVKTSRARHAGKKRTARGEE